MSILTMNMSSYEIEPIDICSTEVVIDECTDWYPETGLQQYSTGQPLPLMSVLTVDPDTFLNRMYSYQQ